MKILITGATGFLGSWLVRELSINNEVVALIRQNSNIWRIKDIPKIGILESDSANFQSTLKIVNPDVLIIGDWWGVGNSFRNDDRQFENLSRFQEIVSTALDYGVSRIVGLGSQAELGSVSGLIPDEQESNPTTKYGESKALAHNYLSEQSQGSRTKYIWGRIFSTYGAMDNSSWMIPSLYQKLSTGQTFRMTSGTQTWSYLHAFDFASAIAHLIDDASVVGAVNIGNPNTLTIKEFASISASVLNRSELLDFGAIPFRVDEVLELRPNTQKLRDIGWEPKISFEFGVKHAFNWLSGLTVDDFRGLPLPNLQTFKD
jgi:nucleoside-diphosphate-sugar epimerase